MSISLASATRPEKNEVRNGDLVYIADICPEQTLMALLDLAGHGSNAYRHAVAVKAILSNIKKSSINDEYLITLANKIHERLKGTSHAALVLCIIYKHENRISYIHVGDIQGKVFGKTARTLIEQQGRAGLAMRSIRLQSENLLPDEFMVFCTDGIRGEFNLNSINIESGELRKMPKKILEKFGKDYDDASCVILRGN